MAELFEHLEGKSRPEWFATSDPDGRPLGSGGGTVHLLLAAWQGTGSHLSFGDWLRASRKLIIHGGGQSRRLPAYALVGKSLMPIPVFRWSRGQRLDQNLLDLQVQDYDRVLRAAPDPSRVLVTSGDVLLRFAHALPPLPAVDVLGLGMRVDAEQASHFGVFFTPRARPGEWACFLQKPAPDRIRELAIDWEPFVDTGMWLLSERAVAALLARSGVDPANPMVSLSAGGRPAPPGRGEAGAMAGDASGLRGRPPTDVTGGPTTGGCAAARPGCHFPDLKPHELYAEFGLALGSQPTVADAALRHLTCAVVALPEAEFYHFGSSRQLIESASFLQNRALESGPMATVAERRHPDQFQQNSRTTTAIRWPANHTLWVENSTVPASWQLAHDHVLTGVPDNTWPLVLEPGVCLDFVPVGERALCLRAYGIDDRFHGALNAPTTLWLGRPAADWLARRGIDCIAGSLVGGQPRLAASMGDMDIQQAPLFPVLEEFDAGFVRWLFAAEPGASVEFRDRWLHARRLSARDLAREVNLRRLYAQRSSLRSDCLPSLYQNRRASVFLRLDLQATAGLFAQAGLELPGPDASSAALAPLQKVHEEMFRAAYERRRASAGWEEWEARAFQRLREAIIEHVQLSPVQPRCGVQEDQIVWGRSPVRLDLAGGWSDTPPYCLEHGGKVLNVAVDLNGQPPIQVFAKLGSEPEIVLRSIDLGTEQRVRTFAELDTYAQPGSEFAVAKAGLALAGFLPRFCASGRASSLRAQLQDFGGGIELSFLAAVPKGSGLGTSSILAATLLGTVSDLCGLGWDRHDLFLRTLALEQMLTTGGGWQDQAGGLFPGIKLIETDPGLTQRPTLRWLPSKLFERAESGSPFLLYYTGITRMAKGILQEIVRGIFLNSAEHLQTIGEIRANALTAFEALQRLDYAGLAASIRASWTLNQRLDRGTNPPAVAAILDQVQGRLAGAKLLGAGGGGYLLMLAKDPDAARAIRSHLTAQPPNPRARFLDMSLSGTGLQITRS